VVIPADPTPGVTTLDFAFRIDRVPADDLVAIVDSQSAGGGVHAEKRFRFGRPDPVLQVPRKTGPSLKIGGRDYGPSVLMNGK
jgi:hypothetical protein